MTPFQKRAFIDELINNVHSAIVDKIDAMPDEWDGHELRRYVADKFEENAITVGRKGPYGKAYARRFREYRNTVIVRNL